MIRSHGIAASAPLVLALLGVACGGNAPAPVPEAPPAPIVDLRADTNRNGKIDLEDPTEDANEDTWDATHGAIFLANLDDDLKACPTKGPGGTTLGDDELAACNDAANEVVDGDDDLLDLAPLATVPYPGAPAEATGTLSIDAKAAPYVRLFRKVDGAWMAFDPATTAFTADEIRAGLDLRLEGKDVVRDPEVWAGTVDVTYRVTHPGSAARAAFDASDVVRLRVAPVLLSHHASPAERVFATKIEGAESTDFRADLQTAMKAAGLGTLEALDVPNADQWTQDFFETGFMSMPAEGGGQHVMRVVLRSANVYTPKSARAPLRPAGRVVFTFFRGKDVAGLQAYDATHSEASDSLNSFGNTETIPPHESGGKKWPLGRLLRGSIKSFAPDPVMAKLFDAQRVQAPVLIDTSWLLVGHVDETLSFLPVLEGTPKERPWLLLAADPTGAKKLLEAQVAAGQGETKMFVDRFVYDADGVEQPATVTIAAALADADRMAASATAAAAIDGQLEVLRTEVGLTDDQLVRAPFLFETVYEQHIAYQPGTVNGILVGPTHFASPKPHGPVIEGKDLMEANLEKTLSAKGIQVHWVEDWDLYHRDDGEVHCGSNVFRAIPSAKWWETWR